MSKVTRLAIAIAVSAFSVAPFANAATPAGGDAVETKVDATQTSDKTLTCTEFKPRQTSADIDSFMSNPSQLLQSNPTGGIGLVNSARNLAGTDLRTVKALIELAAKANEAQQAAIASGLSNAAATCAATSPQYGEAIAKLVAESQVTGLVAAYLRSDAQNATAATSAAAGGYTGGGATDGSSSQFSGANGYSPNGDSPIDVTSGAYDIGGSGNTLIESVSPSQ